MAALTRAYARCSRGHYFAGFRCPMDGQSTAASRELTKLLESVAPAGQGVSLEDLERAGASEAMLAEIIVIEFGSHDAAFEALDPEAYFVGGRCKPMLHIDPRFP